MAISPLWMRMVIRLRYQKVRQQYAAQLFQYAKPTEGWCDAEGLVQWDGVSAIRTSWQLFDRCLFFPKVIQLWVQADPRLRIVLPWHFFADAEEFTSARQVITAQLTVAPTAVIKQVMAEPQTLPFDGCPRRCDTEQVAACDAQRWPFPSRADGQADFVLNPAAALQTFAARFRLWGSATVLLLTLAFPFWVGTLGYALLKVILTDRWEFIADDPLWVLVLAIPAIYMCFLFNAICRRMLTTRAAQRQMLFLRIRDEGLYIRRDSIEAWIHRQGVSAIETGGDAVGWSVPAQIEPVRLPREMFPDEESLRACAEQLQRLESAVSPTTGGRMEGDS